VTGEQLVVNRESLKERLNNSVLQGGEQMKTMRLGDYLLDLSSPRIMGILNVTPDSFYDGGRYENREMILIKAGRMIEEGADILDVGACSTRPGAPDTDEATEKARLDIALSAIRDEYPDAVVSVDTFRAGIAGWAVEEYGVRIINDISGGDMDPDMFSTIGRLHVPYIMMHMQGTPRSMQQNPAYGDVVGDISAYFAEKVNRLRKLGAADILIDPGFGFGKTIRHNYELLAKLMEFRILGLPIVVGISRKSMIYKVLNSNPESALNGTTALHMTALMNGANILRVHDVRQAAECIALYKTLIP
jgi:dihydropteroate synthase